MKTIKVTVPKVHCVRKNDLFGKDEVYLVMIVTSTNVNSEPKIIFSGVSDVLKIKKNHMKALNLGSDWSFTVNDDEAFDVSFGLYEYDKGDAYRAFKNEITQIIETDGNDYKEIISTTWEIIKQHVSAFNWEKLILALPEIGIAIFRQMRIDDFIGKKSLLFKANDPGIKFISEHDMKANQTHYKVQIALN